MDGPVRIAAKRKNGWRRQAGIHDRVPHEPFTPAGELIRRGPDQAKRTFCPHAKERSMLNYLERRMFKEAPGGYIFQPPPPTRFTTTEAYLVDEAKRAEILTITRAGGVTAGRVVTFGSLALAIVAGVATSIGDAPMAVTIVIAFCLFLVAQIAGTCLVLYWKLRRVQPVLAGLPRSDERLFPQTDRRRLLWGPPTPHAAAFWCAVCGFLLGYNSASHPPFTNVSSTIFVIIFAVSLFWAIQATSKSFRDTNATERLGMRREEGHMKDLQPQAQSADAIERLASRLERQEGYLAGLRWIVPGMMIFVVTGFGFSLGLFKHSEAGAQTVVAEAFALKSSNGDLVARLGTTPDGAPSISFFDKERKPSPRGRTPRRRWSLGVACRSATCAARRAFPQQSARSLADDVRHGKSAACGRQPRSERPGRQRPCHSLWGRGRAGSVQLRRQGPMESARRCAAGRARSEMNAPIPCCERPHVGL
jgi:HAMP domain-containing protein